MPFSSQIPPFAAEVLRRLEAAGFQAFAVGGCVRDTLLGRRPHDWDVATDAGDGDIAALFERTAPTGVRYGTVTVLTEGGGVEVTTFRRDGAYLDGRRPESVGFTGSLEEDLRRRDFTVNALAMDRNGKITDCTGGLRDLSGGVLRCVGDPARRFGEDALRMLRGVRFSAQLGFEIEPATLETLRKMSSLARRLSAERVREELLKTLASERPEYVKYMLEYGLLDSFLRGRGEDIPFGRLRQTPEALRLPVFALLCESRGAAEDAGALLRALRCPAVQVRDAAEASELAGRLRPEALPVRLALCAHRTEPVLIAAGAGGFYGLAGEEAAAGRFVRVPELCVDGRALEALGLSGPEIGRALRALSLGVTAGTLENTPDSLLPAVRGRKYLEMSGDV